MTPETNSQKLPDRIVSLARRPWVKPVIEQGGWYYFACFHVAQAYISKEPEEVRNHTMVPRRNSSGFPKKIRAQIRS